MGGCKVTVTKIEAAKLAVVVTLVGGLRYYAEHLRNLSHFSVFTLFDLIENLAIRLRQTQRRGFGHKCSEYERERR